MAVKIDWERVAAAVKDARLELHWSIEEATRRANLSSKTYRQVERGERVHFRSLEAIQRAFGWPPNMAELISSGHHPSEIMRDRPRQQTALEDPPHNDLNTVDAYEEVLKFSMRALRSNADPDVVETFQRSAARLLKEIQKHESPQGELVDLKQHRAHKLSSQSEGTPHREPTSPQAWAARHRNDPQRRKSDNEPPAPPVPKGFTVAWKPPEEK